MPFWQQASYYTALKDNRNVPGSLEVEDACDERESVKVDVEAGNCALGATTCCRSLLSGLVSLCTLAACFCALGLVTLAGWPVQNTCSHFETIQVPFLWPHTRSALVLLCVGTFLYVGAFLWMVWLGRDVGNGGNIVVKRHE